jgi:hypothetical protein
MGEKRSLCWRQWGDFLACRFRNSVAVTLRGGDVFVNGGPCEEMIPHDGEVGRLWKDT